MNSSSASANPAKPARPWMQRRRVPEVYDRAIQEGLSALQSSLIAGRLARLPGSTLRELLNPTSAHLPRASNLPDIGDAARCIAEAVEAGECIALVVDHDADGQNSGVVVWKALTEMFGVDKGRLHVVTSHRLKEGYGVSSKLVQRILSLDPQPTCVITADQGSTDEPRIAELLRHGVRSVITDHHHLPLEGPPASAVACVNPARQDSTFGDPTICGAMVAWYCMVAVQQELARRGATAGRPEQLLDLLSYVAVATCGDCVDLGMSHANRWAVQRGIARILKGGQPVWEAFAPFVRNEWTSTSISYQVVPRINVVGRLGDARRGIDAMCATELRDAYVWVQVLDDANVERKAIQSVLTERAREMAQAAIDDGAPALCLPFYTGGHAGVHGIVASRMVELFGVPTICLSPAEGEPGIMTGSLRSVEGVHIKHVLDVISNENPGLGIRHGGHAMAGGLRLPVERVADFAVAWELKVAEAMADLPPAMRDHDGALDCAPSKALVDEIQALAPFGRGFPEPVFLADVEVLRVSALGKDGKHCQLDTIFPDGSPQRMVWFASVPPDGTMPVKPGRHQFIYELGSSSYSRGPGYDLKIRELV